VNHIAYRLPTFLFTLIGVFATYSLGKRLYNVQVGKISALLIFSSQIYILHNHDVRTDTLLTNFVIIAIWQWVTYIDTQKWGNLVWTFVAIGFAMLAKGPIGAVVPIMAIGSHLLYSRNWKGIFDWKYLVGVLIVLLVLAPMLWGLYLQFDANPAAYVNGRTGVSGLRFFFWEQSFGRITGENVWKDDSSYFFFTHNYLWEFLPWSILGIAGLFTKLRQLVIDHFKFNSSNEMYTIGGFIFPFIALSTSHYKLPHYIMVIMPLAAIYTAHFIDSLLYLQKVKLMKIFSGIQLFFSLLVGVLMVVIIYFFFPSYSSFWWILTMLMFTGIVVLYLQKKPWISLLGPSVFTAILANIIMNGYFYPQLNQYQSGRVLADWVVENSVPNHQMVLLYKHYHNLNFYSKEINYDWVDVNRIDQITDTSFVYVFTNQKGLDDLKNGNLPFQHKMVLYNYPNTELSMEFLNPKTRQNSLEKLFLVEVEKK
jgi:4-amino-4-deoxy-L-arabinose transferase-like glycosyltransferase